MIEGDLCAKGLHPRAGDGPCAKCKPGERCKSGLHDLTLPGATYTLKDGRRRCAECRRDRKRRSRAKAKRAEAEEARGVVEATPEKPTFAVPTGYVSRAERARYRHAVMIRRSKGLLP